MRKWIAAGMMPLLLAGCGSSEYVHSQEPRSTVYYGQPVADLYENFGTPTKATRISDNERILIYISQEIEKDWAYRYVRGCVMEFRLIDNRVVDWSADGQACVIQSRKADDLPEYARGGNNDYYEDTGLFDSADGYRTNSASSTYRSGSRQLPADAFDGKASTSYSKISSVTTPEIPISGKASDSGRISGQVPADAFDGKASATYYRHSTNTASNSAVVNQVTGVAQVPADAFHGQASTFYNPQVHSQTASMQNGVMVTSGQVRQGNSISVPADAFEGRASTIVPQQNVMNASPMGGTSQSVRSGGNATSSSWFDGGDESDEWGLFDS